MKKNQHHETLLLETLLSGLDARESARRYGSHILIYLADMLVLRAREELNAAQALRPCEETTVDLCDSRAAD